MLSSLLEWVILDGDNTLWDVETLYDRARESLCALLAKSGADPRAVDQFQRARDVDLYRQYGYSPNRFPQSFVDTLEHYLGLENMAMEQQVRDIAKDVFRTKAPPAPDVDQVLQRLRPRYSLALLTAGDAAIQAQRLEAFGRTDYFTAIQIVPSKTKESLDAFLADHLIDCKCAWVVGDSLRSDIEPAVALGVRAIHLDVGNWHPVERGHRELPAGVQQAPSLLEVCAILGC